MEKLDVYSNTIIATPHIAMFNKWINKGDDAKFKPSIQESKDPRTAETCPV